MIIGSLSGIEYGAFAAVMAPVAIFGLLITLAVIGVSYRDEFLSRTRLDPVRTRTPRYNRALIAKSLAVTAAMVVLFFIGKPISEVAILGGALLLVTRRIKPQKIYFAVDWPLLVMFIGLFIVVAGLDKAVIGPSAIATIKELNLQSVPVLAAVTAVLGNIVSNVPAVLVLSPFLPSFADPERAWLVVAMASTLAGNLTIVGSVANLIVVQRARSGGVELTFWTHFRVGLPVTLLSILFGVWWLS